MTIVDMDVRRIVEELNPLFLGVMKLLNTYEILYYYDLQKRSFSNSVDNGASSN